MCLCGNHNVVKRLLLLLLLLYWVVAEAIETVFGAKIFVYIFGKRKKEELLTFAEAPFAASVPYFRPHEFQYFPI